MPRIGFEEDENLCFWWLNVRTGTFLASEWIVVSCWTRIEAGECMETMVPKVIGWTSERSEDGPIAERGCRTSKFGDSYVALGENELGYAI
jgi:hypothetical protein